MGYNGDEMKNYACLYSGQAYMEIVCQRKFFIVIELGTFTILKIAEWVVFETRC